jgi:hypothetical protein
VFQVGYVGSVGSPKLSIMLDINQLPGGGTVINPVSRASTIDGNYISQYPNFGSINQLNSIGTSSYNALQSTLRLRSWHGLTAESLAYTWAHELDEISAYRGAIPYGQHLSGLRVRQRRLRHAAKLLRHADLGNPRILFRAAVAHPRLASQQLDDLPRRAADGRIHALGLDIGSAIRSPACRTVSVSPA